MTEVNASDLQAIGDVCDWLIEQSDSMSADKAIELLEAAIAAEAKLKLAIDMLKAQAMKTIEQPILVGHTAYAKKPQIKYRPDQTRIAAIVVNTALERNQETGEVHSAEEAAERAVNMMSALYVSPSTVPKIGGLNKLGLSLGDVTREEHTGWELRRTIID